MAGNTRFSAEFVYKLIDEMSPQLQKIAGNVANLNSGISKAGNIGSKTTKDLANKFAGIANNLPSGKYKNFANSVINSLDSVGNATINLDKVTARKVKMLSQASKTEPELLTSRWQQAIDSYSMKMDKAGNINKKVAKNLTQSFGEISKVLGDKNNKAFLNKIKKSIGEVGGAVSLLPKEDKIAIRAISEAMKHSNMKNLETNIGKAINSYKKFINSSKNIKSSVKSIKFGFDKLSGSISNIGARKWVDGLNQKMKDVGYATNFLSKNVRGDIAAVTKAYRASGGDMSLFNRYLQDAYKTSLSLNNSMMASKQVIGSTFGLPTINGVSVLNSKLKQQVALTDESIQEVRQLGVAYMRMGMIAGQVGQALTMAITVPTVAIGAIGTKFMMDTQDFRVTLRTLLGDSKKAIEMEQELMNFAAYTPFTAQESRSTALSIIPYFDDITPDQLIEKFTNMGNMAAAFNAKIEDIGRIYAKVQAKEDMTAREANMFAQRGIPIWKLLSRSFDISTSEVRKAASARGDIIGAKELEKMLQDVTKWYPNAMKDLSNTMRGQLSVFSDLFQLSSGKMAEIFWNSVGFNDIMKSVNGKMEQFYGKIKDSNVVFGKLVILGMSLPALAGPALMATGKVFDQLGNFWLYFIGRQFLAKDAGFGMLKFIDKLLIGSLKVGLVFGKWVLIIGGVTAALYGASKLINKITGEKGFLGIGDKRTSRIKEYLVNFGKDIKTLGKSIKEAWDMFTFTKIGSAMASASNVWKESVIKQVKASSVIRGVILDGLVASFTGNLVTFMESNFPKTTNRIKETIALARGSATLQGSFGLFSNSMSMFSNTLSSLLGSLGLKETQNSFDILNQTSSLLSSAFLNLANFLGILEKNNIQTYNEFMGDYRSPLVGTMQETQQYRLGELDRLAETGRSGPVKIEIKVKDNNGVIEDVKVNGRGFIDGLMLGDNKLGFGYS